MSGKAKKYLSKDWLYLRYVIQKVSVDDIAKECEVHPLTVYRYLWRFRILEKNDDPRKSYGRISGKEIRK